jgi:cytochrome o ubiquinol oxidase operon protein cyoD
MNRQDLREREVRGHLLGLGAALALTCAAFAAVRWPFAGAPATLGMVFVLGLLQIIVHFACFLHVNLRRSSRDRLYVTLFSALITLLMVSGSLVILTNLHHRMM